MQFLIHNLSSESIGWSERVICTKFGYMGNCDTNGTRKEPEKVFEMDTHMQNNIENKGNNGAAVA